MSPWPRNDNESTYVLRSDRVLRWDVAELALTPTEPWEVVQAQLRAHDGNRRRMLVLMHGVGPMRRYVLSAVLLDWTSRPRSSDGFASPCWNRRRGNGMAMSPTWCTLRRLDSPRHAGCPLRVSDTRISVATALYPTLAAMD